MDSLSPGMEAGFKSSQRVKRCFPQKQHSHHKKLADKGEKCSVGFALSDDTFQPTATVGFTLSDDTFQSSMTVKRRC